MPLLFSFRSLLLLTPPPQGSHSYCTVDKIQPPCLANALRAHQASSPTKPTHSKLSLTKELTDPYSDCYFRPLSSGTSCSFCLGCPSRIFRGNSSSSFKIQL